MECRTYGRAGAADRLDDRRWLAIGREGSGGRSAAAIGRSQRQAVGIECTVLDAERLLCLAVGGEAGLAAELLLTPRHWQHILQNLLRLLKKKKKKNYLILKLHQYYEQNGPTKVF